MVDTTTRPLGSATGVFGTCPGVVDTTAGPLGSTSRVLGTPPSARHPSQSARLYCWSGMHLLSSISTTVDDQVLDDEGASEAASFPHARTVLVPGRLLVEHDVA